jgi:hypothetical protein
MAFQQGREHDGFKYLCAYAVTTDQGAADVLPKIEWVTGLKGPLMGVRWGIGAQVTPDSYRGDFKPVGVTQQLPQRRTGARGGYGGGSGAEGGAPPTSGMEYGAPGGGAAGNAAGLSRFAGELGERLLAEFESRIQNGNFGQILRDAPVAGGAGAGPGAGAYGGEYGAEGSGGSAAMSGPSYPGGSMPPGGSGFGAPGGVRGPAAAAAPQITRGMSFLGLDSQEKLLQKAAREGLQVLVLLNMEMTVNRKTNLITNETEMLLFDVAKKTQLYATDKFNNLKIQNERQGNKDDGVKEQFDKLFKFVDENLLVTAPPATLNAANVLVRVSSLASAKHDSVLPVLAEIRFWQRKGLLPEAEMLNAYKQLLGDEPGTQLVSGDDAAKRKALEKWLPRG